MICDLLTKCDNTPGDRMGTKKELTSANDGFCQNKHLQRKKTFLFIFTFVNMNICTFYQSLSGWSRFIHLCSRLASQSLLLWEFPLYFFSFVCKDTIFLPSKRKEWRYLCLKTNTLRFLGSDLSLGGHFLGVILSLAVPPDLLFCPSDTYHIISSEDKRFSLGYGYLI